MREQVKAWFPLLVVLASAVYLISTVWFVSYNKLFVADIFSSIIAVLSLAAYWGVASGFLQQLLFVAKIKVLDNGTLELSQKTKQRIAKIIRKGNVERIKAEWIYPKDTPRRAVIKTKNSEEYLSVDSYNSGRLFECLRELSVRYRSIEASLEGGKLTDDELVMITLGIVKRIYYIQQVNIEAYWAMGGFHVMGVENRTERGAFNEKLLLSTRPTAPEGFETWPPGMLSLDKYPRDYVVSDFIPALICSVHTLRKRYASKGGIVEAIDRYYWAIKNWNLEIRC